MNNDHDLIVRRREYIERGESEAELARLLRHGDLTSISPGAYVDSTSWRELTPQRKYRLRVISSVERLRNQSIISHFSAAAIWGMDVWKQWPATIDLLVPHGSARSSGAFRRHGCDVDRHDVVPFGRHLVTSPAQTAVDLATVVPFPEAVVTVDSALRLTGAASTDSESLRVALSRIGGLPGTRRAAASLSFGDQRAESPLESFSRARIAEFGFVEPELQAEFLGPGSFRARVDFWWPDQAVIGEADGLIKYGATSDPETAHASLLREKDREDILRRRVSGFARWTYQDAVHPTRLQSILDTAGVPRQSHRLYV